VGGVLVGHGQDGGVVVGKVGGNATFNINPPAAVPRLRLGRSVYLQQVRRIAPPDPPGLLGRQGELGELAAFCTDAGRGPYVW
jgi:hypothetical protein